MHHINSHNYITLSLIFCCNINTFNLECKIAHSREVMVYDCDGVCVTLAHMFRCLHVARWLIIKFSVGIYSHLRPQFSLGA